MNLPSDLFEVSTPALVLELSRLRANAAFMAARAASLGVKMRPHMKTAKSADVARLATEGFGGITVSTLAEARYFLEHGFADVTYAVGLAPCRIREARELVRTGCRLKVLTDSPEVARLIADDDTPLDVLIEIDCGDARGGVKPDSPDLLDVAKALQGKGARLAGVLTHAGQSYACGSVEEIADVAEQEKAAAVHAAERLRTGGYPVDTVSVGSTPTATHARDLTGVTEMRPGVYMFGDLDQLGLGSMPGERIAVTVLASVIGVYPDRLIVDAGGLALSKDTSAQRHNPAAGYGLVQNIRGETLPGASVVTANQEHGIIRFASSENLRGFKIGDRVRIVPNHICMTAAAHPGYHVVDGGVEVTARWGRIHGWEQW